LTPGSDFVSVLIVCQLKRCQLRQSDTAQCCLDMEQLIAAICTANAVQLTLAKVTGCEPELHKQQGAAASLKADSVTVTQEILRISLNPNVLCLVYKIPPLVRTLSQLHPVHFLTPYLTSISKLSSHLPLGFPSFLFVSGFFVYFCTNSLPTPCILLVRPIQAALYVVHHIINKHVS